MVNIIKSQEYGRNTGDLCREYGISQAIFYNWKKKYSSMDMPTQKAQRTGRRKCTFKTYVC
ncbi:transposase [Ascidiimonas meishanensis]|uniref:transposase n=1 Tax=Ascidiimonas meishanensis TaxID=3128903 RepID=UPI0039B73B95